MDDDDIEADSDFLAVLAASGAEKQQQQQQQRQPPPPQQLPPQRIQQPIPQRLHQPPQPRDQAGLTHSATAAAVPTSTSPTSSSSSKPVQPRPQALPQRSAGSSILVSPRQRGNPVLTSLRSQPWEYSDIPADYVMGATTCALFLSLKYHRLHPEYVYTRIRNLQGKYNLRVLLTLVDIPNHEEPLRELSKASLINKVTLILCWSASEAARYLELYKACEHAGFSAIRGQQTSSYGEKLVEFVTVPRSINKADAVALVSNFGSLRNAVNAEPEQLGIMGGWGEVKIKRWCAAVEEPFRFRKNTITTQKRDDLAAAAAATATTTATATPVTTEAATTATATENNEKEKPRGRGGGEKHPEDEEKDSSGRVAAAPATIASDVTNVDPSSDKDSFSGSPGLAPGIAAALARLREDDR